MSEDEIYNEEEDYAEGYGGEDGEEELEGEEEYEQAYGAENDEK